MCERSYCRWLPDRKWVAVAKCQPFEAKLQSHISCCFITPRTECTLSMAEFLCHWCSWRTSQTPIATPETGLSRLTHLPESCMRMEGCYIKSPPNINLKRVCVCVCVAVELHWTLVHITDIQITPEPHSERTFVLFPRNQCYGNNGFQALVLLDQQTHPRDSQAFYSKSGGGNFLPHISYPVSPPENEG